MAPGEFANVVLGLLAERTMTLRGLAREIPVDAGQLSRILNGKRLASEEIARRCDKIFDTDGLLARAAQRDRAAGTAPPGSGGFSTQHPAVLARTAAVPVRVVAGARFDVELEAVELARRVEASDVGVATMDRLEDVADGIAMAYAGTPPEQLLPRVHRHLHYIAHLIDARKTLEQHRRLLVTGSWLSLLAATLYIDLGERDAAHAWLTTAEQMAGDVGHDEIQAWCYETRAWELLTEGRLSSALALAQRAQIDAPAGSSVLIQATAQEGRAWARMGRSAETRNALNRVARLVSNLRTPENAEHHYRYDPVKAISYTATTLAWVGDPAAEEFARAAVFELTCESGGAPRPRRVATARLDLSLALLAAGRPDEASAEALTAVASGRIVPSNWWRATEVLHGVEQAGIPEFTDLQDAYHTFQPVWPDQPS